MTNPEEFGHDKQRKLSDWLNGIAMELEAIAPVITSSANNVAFAGQAIGELVKGSGDTGATSAAPNCEYARRWLAGHQVKGADHHVAHAAEVLRKVVGHVDPG